MLEYNFPVPKDETARVDALRTYNVLDTPPEKEFDDLVRLAAQICQCPVAAITLVDGERQWYKARIGLDLPYSARSETGLCSNAILGHEPMIVPDTEKDPRFSRSPAAIQLGLRFYAGVPLINRENHALGTLCVLDRVPRRISAEQLDGLRILARQVMAQLELRRLAYLGEFRERLVSILSNDLRQPLQQILLAARQGMRPVGPGSPEQRYLSQIAISAERLTRMVRDVLDFTRTRLGDGLVMKPRPTSLAIICRRVVQEFALSYPGRDIQLEIVDEGAGLWDEDRLAQAVSNLVANALRHGASERPIRLSCAGDGDECVLAVRNEGSAIPRSVLPRLFGPFCRAAATGEAHDAPLAGLGLGLFIVREIARACGGTVDVSSTEVGTTFRLRLPRVAGAAEAFRPILRH